MHAFPLAGILCRKPPEEDSSSLRGLTEVSTADLLQKGLFLRRAYLERSFLRGKPNLATDMLLLVDFPS